MKKRASHAGATLLAFLHKFLGMGTLRSHGSREEIFGGRSKLNSLLAWWMA